MTEALHLISLRAKWKKILKGKPTTEDLKNYLRDVKRYGLLPEINGKLV